MATVLESAPAGTLSETSPTSILPPLLPITCVFQLSFCNLQTATFFGFLFAFTFEESTDGADATRGAVGVEWSAQATTAPSATTAMEVRKRVWRRISAVLRDRKGS